MAGSSAISRARPDPRQAHGAWVYLFAAVGAGAIVGAGRGLEAALLVGTGFVGAFLATAAVTVGPRRKRRQLLVGLATAIAAPLLALWLGADRAFLYILALACLPAILAVFLAARLGFLSRSALTTGIAALALAAPAAALAGGSSVLHAALVFLFLWPFFSWRSLRLAAPLEAGGKWDREQLRARGLREASIAALWSLAVAVGLSLG